MRLHFLQDAPPAGLGRDLEVVARLQVQPELRARPKEPRQPERGVGGNAPALPNDVVHPRRGHAQSYRQGNRWGLACVTFALVAPDLIVSEIGNALRSAAVLKKRIPTEVVAGAMADFLRIELPTRSAGQTASRAIELALQHNATFYDAAYVALALEEGIPVLTTDGPMTEKFAGMVEFVKIRMDRPDKT